MGTRGRHRRARAARADQAGGEPDLAADAMREEGGPDELGTGLSAEQRAEIEPWLQEGETLTTFIAAAIRTELAWRQMIRRGGAAAPRP